MLRKEWKRVFEKKHKFEANYHSECRITTIRIETILKNVEFLFHTENSNFIWFTDLIYKNLYWVYYFQKGSKIFSDSDKEKVDKIYELIKKKEVFGSEQNI